MVKSLEVLAASAGFTINCSKTKTLSCHEKGWSKSVPVYALQSLENVLGLARFRVFVPNIYMYDPQKYEVHNIAPLGISDHMTIAASFSYSPSMSTSILNPKPKFWLYGKAIGVH